MIIVPNVPLSTPMQNRIKIQQALAITHANGGGTVMLQGGVYEIDRAIDMLDGTTLAGEGSLLFQLWACVVRITENTAPWCVI